jgi:phosphopentomutase
MGAAMIGRLVVLVADGLGCGNAPDAGAHHSDGADTLGVVLTRAGERDVALPTLGRLGILGIDGGKQSDGRVWALVEHSGACDTPSGHWELTGRATPAAPPTYLDGFPPELVSALANVCNVDGFLGNVAINGVEAINRWGAQSDATQRPILYTSADSVCQIAASEDTFGLSRLYGVCEQARAVFVGDAQVGRVIARPYHTDGSTRTRTGNRKDWATPAPDPTALDLLQAGGVPTVGVGKIGDIYDGRGLSVETRPHGDEACMEATIDTLATLDGPGLIYTNLVDFDTSYGHLRDLDGYVDHLAWFDGAVAKLCAAMCDGDRLVVCADHGNDPTWQGNDHTRERVPALVWGQDLEGGGWQGEADMVALGHAMCSFFNIDSSPLDDTTTRLELT